MTHKKDVAVKQKGEMSMAKILGISVPAIAALSVISIWGPSWAHSVVDYKQQQDEIARAQAEVARQNALVTPRTSTYTGTIQCKNNQILVFDKSETGGIQDLSGAIELKCAADKELSHVKAFVDGDVTKTPVEGVESNEGNATFIVNVNYSWNGSNNVPNTPVVEAQNAYVWDSPWDIVTAPSEIGGYSIEGSGFKFENATITPVA